jgi:hypothetical protein
VFGVEISPTILWEEPTCHSNPLLQQQLNLQSSQRPTTIQFKFTEIAGFENFLFPPRSNYWKHFEGSKREKSLASRS